MFLNITDKNEAENKGSSAKLVHYLDKENRLFPEIGKEEWFSHNLKVFESYEVRNEIDGNIAKLGQQDAKFFLLNISPSQKEIAHLKALFGEHEAKTELKKFAISIMDEYARNFKRKGINSNEDLVWFAKLENHRYYSHKDQEVKQGIALRGAQKPGEQMHVQVIISRKDKTNKIKLSPKNNSRGTNIAHSKKVGQFDRVAFKASGERVFDETYHFNRPISESFRHANTQVNGTLADRLAMNNLIVVKHTNGKDQFQKQSIEVQSPKCLEYKDSEGLMDILLTSPEYNPLVLPGKKNKRKKRTAQDNGLNF